MLRILLGLFCGCWVTGVCTPGQAAEPARLTAVENEQGVTILEGIQPVMTYQRSTTSLSGKWPRAHYVHPLYGLDGEVLSEDFPQDHRHHRGIFWAWHQVLVDGQPQGDAWACVDFQWDVQDVQVATAEDHIQLSTTTLWKSPALRDEQGEPRACVREETSLRVHPTSQGVRWIDFDIQLWALLEKVSLGGSDDDKGYGGFSARVKLYPETQFLSAGGVVEPQFGAVSAGNWLDIRGPAGGVVIVQHPDNPGFPQPWILRSSRSMQNPAYPGRQPVQLSMTQPLRLRYRLGIYLQPPPLAALEAR